MVSTSYVMMKLVTEWFGNINLGIDFNVNNNFNNDFLDWQLSRAKPSSINIFIKDVGHKLQPKQNNKNYLGASSEIVADSFSKIKKLELNIWTTPS